MKKLWNQLQTILVQAKLRLPLYVLTLLTGTAFFLAPNSISPTYFVICLGLLVIFETIHPKGYIIIIEELTISLPKRIQRIVLYVILCILLLLGAFILWIGMAVEWFQWLK